MRNAVLLVAAAASAFALPLIAATQAQAPKIDPQAAEFFESRIRPLLARSCQPCHGEKIQQGGIRLDSFAALLKGNSGGPVVVIGHPDKSPLIQVVRYDGKVKMPPTGKLKPQEIEDLTEWVRMGAPWPGAPVSDAAKKAAETGEYAITEAQRGFWSFRAVRRPPVPKAPQSGAAVRNPIDAFILARLQKAGLKPNPPADRRTLIRRAYFDLIGLPPTYEEVEAFVADRSPDAWDKVVDRLLASPHYGERWARYWMDLARYSNTRGYVFTEDRSYPNAYTYRDYLIRAFNEDRPYDRFILEQLAADRLNLGEDRRPLAAMGFLTVGRRFLNNQHDIIDDRIDVVSRTFLGLTVNCARCHDHKYDPIPQKDYYALYGIFASSQESNPPPGISPREISEPYDAHNKKLFEAENRVKNIQLAQINVLRDRAKDPNGGLSDEIQKILQGFRVRTLPEPDKLAKLEPEFAAESREELRKLREEIKKLKETFPPTPEFAMAMEDRPEPVKPRVFLRGNPNNPGPEVPRQFLAILSGPERKPFTEGSGRLELARAIADPRNPLTARVMVNRIWMHHFGYGIVRTPSDFGTRGEPPTHPELLDWLASELINPESPAQKWSMKRIHRLIMTSATYKQSAVENPQSAARDPENRLLWRMNRRRLDLEAMRDTMLAVAGNLDRTLYGRSVDLLKEPFTGRRSVYGYIERQNLPGFFRTFDFASPDGHAPRRYFTTTPQQALFMMNSPFLAHQARTLLRRKEITEAADDAAKVRALFRLVFSRNAGDAEVADCLAFLRRVDTRTASLLPIPEAAERNPQSLSAWEQLGQTLLMSNELIFVD